MRCVDDHHVCGLFSRADWLRLLEEVGFRATARRREDSDEAVGWAEVFVAVKPDRYEGISMRGVGPRTHTTHARLCKEGW